MDDCWMSSSPKVEICWVNVKKPAVVCLCTLDGSSYRPSEALSCLLQRPSGLVSVMRDLLQFGFAREEAVPNGS